MLLLLLLLLLLPPLAAGESAADALLSATTAGRGAPARVVIRSPEGRFLAGPSSPFMFSVLGSWFDEVDEDQTGHGQGHAAARACASFHIREGPVSGPVSGERACTSTPLHGGQTIEMQSADLFLAGSHVAAFVVLEIQGLIVAAAHTTFVVNGTLPALPPEAPLRAGRRDATDGGRAGAAKAAPGAAADAHDARDARDALPALTLNDYVKQTNTLRVEADLALHAKDAALAKYKISEAETVAISGLTVAGSTAGVSIAWLTHAFVAVLGERSRYWEILGHWDILLQSYRAVPDEVSVASSLVGTPVPVPAWIRINNATSLPRVFYQRQCRNARKEERGQCDDRERARFVTAGVALRRFRTGIKRLLKEDAELESDKHLQRHISPLDAVRRRLKIHHSRLHRRLLSSGFYLSYLSVHHRMAETKLWLARLHRRILHHSGLPAAPSSKTPKTMGPEGQPLVRVGFASKVLLSDHSISRLLRSTICKLASRYKSMIEVYVIILDDGQMSPVALLRYCRRAKNADALEDDPVTLVEGGGTLESARNAVLRSNLDVLVYPAVGMDFITTLLANMRLAPVQGAWWGHPETTGSSEVDVFLTAKHAEAGAIKALPVNNESVVEGETDEDGRKWAPMRVYSEPYLAEMKGLGGFSMDDPAVALGILEGVAGVEEAMALHQEHKAALLKELGLEGEKEEEEGGGGGGGGGSGGGGSEEEGKEGQEGKKKTAKKENAVRVWATTLQAAPFLF